MLLEWNLIGKITYSNHSDKRLLPTPYKIQRNSSKKVKFYTSQAKRLQANSNQLNKAKLIQSRISDFSSSFLPTHISSHFPQKFIFQRLSPSNENKRNNNQVTGWHLVYQNLSCSFNIMFSSHHDPITERLTLHHTVSEIVKTKKRRNQRMDVYMTSKYIIILFFASSGKSIFSKGKCISSSTNINYGKSICLLCFTT